MIILTVSIKSTLYFKIRGKCSFQIIESGEKMSFRIFFILVVIETEVLFTVMINKAVA